MLRLYPIVGLDKLHDSAVFMINLSPPITEKHKITNLNSTKMEDKMKPHMNIFSIFHQVCP